MEKYAPNKMELASRDVVSRAEQTEINEGRGVGEDGGGIYLDITVVPTQAHARGAARDRQHRQGLRRHRHHARADRDPPRPALHHGRRQDRHQRRHADPGPLRRRRGRLRLGPRRQPPRRELAARHADLRPPLGRARRRARRRACRCRRSATTQLRRRRGRDRRDHRPRAHRPARLGDQGGAGHRDEPQRRRLPRRGGPAPRPRGRAPPQGGGRRRPTSTTAAPSSTRTCSAPSSSATCSTAPRRPSSPRSSARSRAARSSAPTTPSATTSVWLKHIDIGRNGDDVPEVSYSPVTITQWQPEERKY